MNSMKSNVFDKNATSFIKGIAVCFLLVHHLFYSTIPELLTKYDVHFLIINGLNITMYASMKFRICISIFAMMSGYGLSKIWGNKKINTRTYTSFVFSRYIKLISGFVVIFILAQIIAPFFNYNLFNIYGEDLFAKVFVDFLGLANIFGTETFNPTWWYMSLAILIIFLIPFIRKIADTISFAILPLFILLFLLIPNAYSPHIICMMFGVLAEKYSLFEKIKNWKFLNKRSLGILIKSVVSCGLVLASTPYLYTKVHLVAELICAVSIVIFCYELVYEIPLINRMFMFFGKHSANIFMTHTFIFGLFYPKIVYIFKYSSLIFLALLIYCLILSVLLELIKKYTGYNKLVEKCIKKIKKLDQVEAAV